MTKIPVGKTVEYAYSFTFGNILTLIGLSWFAFAIIIVPQFLLRSLYFNPFIAGPGGQPVAMGLVFILLSFAGWVVIAMTKVAFLRQALGLRTGGAVFYFSLGMPVWRVIGAYLLMLVAFLVIYIACIIVFVIAGALFGAILAGIIAAAGMPIAAARGAAIGIILFSPLLIGAILYAFLRLGFFLSTIAVTEERISIMQGWRLTRGNFWRMLGVVLVVDVPVSIVYVVIVLWVLGFNVMPPMHAGITPAEMNDWVRQLTARINSAWMIVIPAYFLLFVLSTGLSAAATAYAYRALLPREDIAAHFA